MGRPGVTAGIVFAAGSGGRFGGPKQFMALGDERVVDRVVRHAAATCDFVVVVVPEGHQWTGPPVDAVAVGGATHAASVRSGMAVVPDTADVVVLATASHPLASAALFRSVVRAVRKGADAATPRGNLADAIKRHVDDQVIETVPKADLAEAQSPSAFDASTLRAALAKQIEVPEELQLLEEAGGQVVFVPGEETNIHVTTPLELEMARLLLPLVDHS